ncbi:AAA family ATPase [Streptomyces sp. NPDC050315]|uniref:helix-turn-helix transcriptional regulator n=1 Tax=Streptomyces sp. NPDC050315 TaxID=3155039 RepID=UPI00343B4CA9
MPIDLFDRNSELRLFDSALSAADVGRSRTVLVHGAAGVGKSSLLDAFAQRAMRSGWEVLRAVGTEGERTVELGVLRQLSQAATAAGLPELSLPTQVPPRVEDLQQFCEVVRNLGRRTPLVYCIDDLHHMDAASLRHFLFLSRHLGAARVVLLAAVSPQQSAQGATLSAELLHRPDVRHIRLGLLNTQAVAQGITGFAAGGRRPDDEAAVAFHELTGGNPLLLKALLTEHRATAGRDGTTPLPRPSQGGLFNQAVAACVRSSGPVARDVAGVFAVLDEHATTELAAELLGLSVSVTAQAVTALESCGVLRELRFRHRDVRDAVLNALSPDVRAGLHRDAAVLLHARGLDPSAVARHLFASQHDPRPWSDVPWATGVLHEQANRALADGHPRQASDMLRLACRICPDEAQRLQITLRHAAVMWRFDPAAAEQLLQAPLAALETGTLPAPARQLLSRLLMEQGRIDAPSVTAGQPAVPGPPAGPAAHQRDPWPTYGVPTTAWWPTLGAPGETTAANAEQLLQNTVLTSGTLHVLIRAVRALLHSGRPDQAVVWCEKLCAEAEGQHAPGWSAAFTTVYAELLLHLGDLSGAEQQALAAMDELPQSRTGFFACAPAAALIRARTAMGRHAAVAQQLEHPVPEELLVGVHGLAYRRARALHLLMTGQFQAAFAELMEVGRAAQEWRLDSPLFLPWRTDAAQALVRLGEPQQAKQLVLQQLSSPDVRHPWVRGTALRLRAQFTDERQGLAMLEQAVEELRRSGDRLELARALADAGRLAQAQGDNTKAGMMTRRAWSLAHACGAEALREEILPGLASRSQPGGSREQVHTVRAAAAGKLSDSERRVAALAAHGYTNREISMKLYITVSTVEQHLTRVYRKLRITRRQDLPMDLQMSVLDLV